jgi:hypothetical protein
MTALADDLSSFDGHWNYNGSTGGNGCTLPFAQRSRRLHMNWQLSASVGPATSPSRRGPGRVEFHAASHTSFVTSTTRQQIKLVLHGLILSSIIKRDCKPGRFLNMCLVLNPRLRPFAGRGPAVIGAAATLGKQTFTSALTGTAGRPSQ